MAVWSKGRGLLGPLKPLVGRWVTTPHAGAPRCTRDIAAFGKGWIQLQAEWDMGPRGLYREVAMFGARPDGALGFYSFTSDGKRSEGRWADAADVHAQAIAFEAEMPAGLARMVYWPLEGAAPGFNFAVESRTRQGWNRFLRQEFVPAPT